MPKTDTDLPDITSPYCKISHARLALSSATWKTTRKFHRQRENIPQVRNALFHHRKETWTSAPPAEELQ